MEPNERATRLRVQEALTRRSGGRAAIEIIEAALAAVDPVTAMSRAMALGETALRVGEHSVPLFASTRIWCVAVGKASRPMARDLARRLGPRLAGGVVVTKHGADPVDRMGRLEVFEGAHPVPDTRSERAGQAVLERVTGLAPEDVVVVLLSGGASSLMVAPAEGISLATIQEVGHALVHCGAPIAWINAVRARLDRLKGGGLARSASPARVVTLVLDDVVDAPLHVVGSGPTLPPDDDDPLADAVIERYCLSISPAVHDRLRRSPPLPAPPGPVVRLAGNDTAVAAACATAAAMGWDVRPLPPLRGEARTWGASLAARLAGAAPSRPTAWIGGGETTVTVRGSGTGGRNQELALAALPGLAAVPGGLVVTLATDGEDGPTDAAGAVVDADSVDRARALGLDPAWSLANNDAYPLFDALGDLLRIGPTGTNVCDLVLALVDP